MEELEVSRRVIKIDLSDFSNKEQEFAIKIFKQIFKILEQINETSENKKEKTT